MVRKVDIQNDGLLAVTLLGLDKFRFVQMFHELFDVLPTGLFDVVMLGLLGGVHRKIRSSEVGYQC